MGQQQINCSPVEFVTITPPSGQTCSQYMDRYISSSGGYLTNPDATSSCQFCGVRTTDELLGANFNIFYRHHWRNFGFMIAYIIFNVRSLSLWVALAPLNLGKLIRYSAFLLWHIYSASALGAFSHLLSDLKRRELCYHIVADFQLFMIFIDSI